MAIQELRQEHDLKLLLEIAQIPRATFYYHVKRMVREDKYAIIKAKITELFHEHQGRYGYRRITDEVNANNVETKCLAAQWLENLQECCKKVNKMFNLNISVNWRFREEMESDERNSELVRAI